jgi:tape measure domain-containing protein
MADAGTITIQMVAELGQLTRDLEKAKKTIKKQSDRMGKDFHRGAKRIETGANRIGYAFNKMRRAAQLFASVFIVTAAVRRIGSIAVAAEKAADKINLMQARFQQFARTGDAFTRIYNLSKNIGVSMDEAANGMTRLLIATKSIGTAQPVIEDVYKNIVTLGRAGGTSMEEMVGGMRQLSQGLASGRLAGEELRSVLENLPLVAMEIADAMGINIGQIRQYAAEGKITGDIIVDALKEVGIKMEDLPQTWAMQTENLRTEWTLFLAELGNAVDNAGLLKELTAAVKWVRTDLMGDLSTHTIDELKAMRDAAEKELVDADWGVKLFADDPEGMKGQLRSLLQDVSKWFGPQGVTAASLMTDDEIVRLFEAREQYRELNEEIAERIRLEQIAAKAGEVRGVLGEEQAFEDFVNGLKIQKGLMGIPKTSSENPYVKFMREFREAVTTEQELLDAEADNIRLTLALIRDAYVEEFGQDSYVQMVQRYGRKIHEDFADSLLIEPSKTKKKPVNQFKEATDEMTEYAKQADDRVR